MSIQYFIVASGMNRGWIYSRSMTAGVLKYHNEFLEGDEPEVGEKLVEITAEEYQAIIDVQDGFREGAEESHRLAEQALKKRNA